MQSSGLNRLYQEYMTMYSCLYICGAHPGLPQLFPFTQYFMLDTQQCLWHTQSVPWEVGHTPLLAPPLGHVYPLNMVHLLSSVIFTPSFTLALKTTRESLWKLFPLSWSTENHLVPLCSLVCGPPHTRVLFPIAASTLCCDMLFTHCSAETNMRRDTIMWSPKYITWATNRMLDNCDPTVHYRE